MTLRTVSTITLLLAVAFSAAACAGQVTPPGPTNAPPELPRAMTADLPAVSGSPQFIPGTIVVREGCVGLAADDGRYYPVVWEPGTTMRDAVTLELMSSPFELPVAVPGASGQLTDAVDLPADVTNGAECGGSGQVLIMEPGLLPMLEGQ